MWGRVFQTSVAAPLFFLDGLPASSVDLDGFRWSRDGWRVLLQDLRDVDVAPVWRDERVGERAATRSLSMGFREIAYFQHSAFAKKG